MKSVIYGPVPSWRLGCSLGIDLVSQDEKTCSFDCAYCQLGRTLHHTRERREFVSINRLQEELVKLPQLTMDYVTFSGSGEPTLALNLGDAIVLAKKSLAAPVAVLTNASLLSSASVRTALAQADKVVAKLDAPTEPLFYAINKPVEGITLAKVVAGLEAFRAEYRGILALQIMFFSANQKLHWEMAELARKVTPDEVELNTPRRRCRVEALPEEAFREIKEAFQDMNSHCVYDSAHRAVVPLDIEATRLRRPTESR
jgi:wyosine [tRNA(Phe)-imidazoG37] synthetase (radical SAM superfamily)